MPSFATPVASGSTITDKQLRIQRRKGRQPGIPPGSRLAGAAQPFICSSPGEPEQTKPPLLMQRRLREWSKALGANRSYPAALLTAGGRVGQMERPPENVCQWTYRCFLASTGFSGDPSPDPGEPIGFPFAAVPTPTPGPLTAPVSLEGVVFLPDVAASLAV
jgi:hypothetical protein